MLKETLFAGRDSVHRLCDGKSCPLALRRTCASGLPTRASLPMAICASGASAPSVRLLCERLSSPSVRSGCSGRRDAAEASAQPLSSTHHRATHRCSPSSRHRRSFMLRQRASTDAPSRSGSSSMRPTSERSSTFFRFDSSKMRWAAANAAVCTSRWAPRRTGRRSPRNTAF
eukprot:6201514-Pleurochrysis_carterae.AAC.3